MPEPGDISYFESKARQCFRLARACLDPKIISTLEQLGYEFVGEAVKLGADPATMPRAGFPNEIR
jgi:hypothetical protein